MKTARQKKSARPKVVPAAPPVTRAGIIISLLGTNDLSFRHPLPMAEAELTEIFQPERFETDTLHGAIRRMVAETKRRWPDDDESHEAEIRPHLHAEAGFVLGLCLGLPIGGAR
jgi:hypothetical protein